MGRPRPLGGDGPSEARLGLLSAATPGWAPDQVCAGAAGAGMAGVEWAAGPGQVLGADASPGQGQHLALLSADHGLTVCGLAAQDAMALTGSLTGFQRLVELARSVGAPHLRVFAPPYAGGSVHDELQRLAQTLAERVGVAGRSGLRLLVEMAPATLVPGPEWLLRVIGGLPPDEVGALYDPASMVIEGHLAPRLAVAALGPYLGHVHVKDVAPLCVDGAWRWERARPGHGLVPWPDVLSCLGAAGYRGWLVVDHLSGPPGQAGLEADVSDVRELLDAYWSSAPS